MKPPGAPKMSRIFFALWPDEPARRSLAQVAGMLREECGGRAMVPANIHATLAFIGNVPSVRVPELEALADALKGTPFDLSIDVLCYWRHNRVVWAGTHACPEALAALAADLQSMLKAHGWRIEDRPYVAHVTLLRDARRGPAAATLEPISWHVSRFALVLSSNDSAGTHYTPLRFWTLEQDRGSRIEQTSET